MKTQLIIAALVGSALAAAPFSQKKVKNTGNTDATTSSVKNVDSQVADSQVEEIPRLDIASENSASSEDTEDLESFDVSELDVEPSEEVEIVSKEELEELQKELAALEEKFEAIKSQVAATMPEAEEEAIMEAAMEKFEEELVAEAVKAQEEAEAALYAKMDPKAVEELKIAKKNFEDVVEKGVEVMEEIASKFEAAGDDSAKLEEAEDALKEVIEKGVEVLEDAASKYDAAIEAAVETSPELKKELEEIEVTEKAVEEFAKNLTRQLLDNVEIEIEFELPESESESKSEEEEEEVVPSKDEILKEEVAAQ